MKKFAFFFLILSAFLKMNAQNNQVDILINNSYLELDSLIYNNLNDTIKAQNYAKSYFLKAKKEKHLLEMEYGQYFLSLITNDFDKYYKLCDSLILECSKKKLIDLELKIRCGKARTYYYNGSMSNTLKENLIINNILKKHKNDSIQYITNTYVGV